MTKNYNYENEAIKKAYFEYLEHGLARSPITIRKIRESLYKLDEFLNFASYKTLNKDTIINFKEHLRNYKSKKNQKRLCWIIIHIRRVKGMIYKKTIILDDGSKVKIKAGSLKQLYKMQSEVVMEHAKNKKESTPWK